MKILLMRSNFNQGLCFAIFKSKLKSNPPHSLAFRQFVLNSTAQYHEGFECRPT